MGEIDEGRRYRLLAARARENARRASDAKIRAAYDDIAQQYETLAKTMDRISHGGADKPSRSDAAEEQR